MGNVVAFPAATAPSLVGAVHCIGCKHQWQAESPVGVFEDLECPNCGAHKGVRSSTLSFHDDNIWRCNCGNDYFLLGMQGAPMCANCGLRATSWAEG